MIHIVWSDDNIQYETTCGDAKSAWKIYWALLKLYEKQDPVDDVRFWMTGPRGNYLDPREGNYCPVKADKEPIILKKART